MLWRFGGKEFTLEVDVRCFTDELPKPLQDEIKFLWQVCNALFFQVDSGLASQQQKGRLHILVFVSFPDSQRLGGGWAAGGRQINAVSNP